jgi:hypothetical protein
MACSGTAEMRLRLEDNTKVDLTVIRCWVVNMIYLLVDQERDSWRALVNTALSVGLYERR